MQLFCSTRATAYYGEAISKYKENYETEMHTKSQGRVQNGSSVLVSILLVFLARSKLTYILTPSGLVTVGFEKEMSLFTACDTLCVVYSGDH